MMMGEETEERQDSVEQRSTEGAQSIRRAVKVINAVASGGGNGLRLTAIAAVVRLHLATTRRILMALVEEGMLQVHPARGTYSLGPLTLHLGELAKQQHIIIEPIRPYLEEIARRSGDTVLLSVRKDDDSLCLLRLEGAFPIRTMTLDVGAVRPLGAGAGSLALLAWLPPEEREAILKKHEPRYSKYSLDLQQIRDTVDRSQRLGYALNDGLILNGISGIGIPVTDIWGNILAAISIAAISSRLSEVRAKELVEMIGDVCRTMQFWSVRPRTQQTKSDL